MQPPFIASCLHSDPVQNATMDADHKKKKHKIGQRGNSSYSKWIAVSFVLFLEGKIKIKSVKLDPLQTKYPSLRQG